MGNENSSGTQFCAHRRLRCPESVARAPHVLVDDEPALVCHDGQRHRPRGGDAWTSTHPSSLVSPRMTLLTLIPSHPLPSATTYAVVPD